MRLGLTTGTCFIAAAKAALVMLRERRALSNIVVELPIGLRVEVRLSRAELHDDTARACVVKDAGDNAPFDITHGVEICVEASLRPGRGDVIVVPVRGLGVYAETGRPAISDRVMEYLLKNIREVLENFENLDVILRVEIPDGERLHKQTLNELFGIVNGIALLGEKGIELPTGSPYHSPHLEHIRVVLERLRASALCLVVGGRSLRKAGRILKGVPILDVGDHAGYALKLALERGFQNIIILAQVGKFIKLAGGIYMLHHYYADARIETLVCRLLEYMLAQDSVDVKLIHEVLKCRTVREALEKLDVKFRRDFLTWLVNYVENRLRRDFKISDNVRICVGTFLNDEEDYFSRSCTGIIQC